MSETYPVLPLRDIVVFPHMIVPLFVGRDKSVAALESAMAADKSIFLVSQLDPAEDDPDREALYDLGVVATVLQLLKLPDGTVRVLVEGKHRATLKTLLARGRPSRRRDRPGRDGRARGRRGEGAGPLGDRAVRELFEGQPQAAGRDRGPARPDRGALASSPTRSPPTSTSRSPTSRPCSPSSIRCAGSKWRSPSWRASWA